MMELSFSGGNTNSRIFVMYVLEKITYFEKKECFSVFFLSI